VNRTSNKKKTKQTYQNKQKQNKSKTKTIFEWIAEPYTEYYALIVYYMECCNRFGIPKYEVNRGKLG
jgi:hypothetical protein